MLAVDKGGKENSYVLFIAETDETMVKMGMEFQLMFNVHIYQFPNSTPFQDFSYQINTA